MTRICKTCDEPMEYVNNGDDEYYFCEDCNIFVKVER